MPGFQFKLSQCVMVPGLVGVQGRVSGRSDFILQPNEYAVTWLDEKLDLHTKTFPEDVLLAPPLVDAFSLPEVSFVAAMGGAGSGGGGSGGKSRSKSRSKRK